MLSARERLLLRATSPVLHVAAQAPVLVQRP